METEQISELRVSITLVHENQEVATIGKFFGILPEHSGQPESVPLDQRVTEFISGLEQRANEEGFRISRDILTQVTISTILFLVRHHEPDLKLWIPVEKMKQEETQNASGETVDT
jgi:hypothetical protein